MAVACLNCGRKYPDVGAPYRCPACGGLFDEQERLTWRELDPAAAGVWRYVTPYGGSGNAVSLGEGNTPLLPADVAGRSVYFKCEYSNPSGSFKDRGSAMLVSFLLSRGVKEAVEDSSGNAGASFAAYAARAGIKARVFAPDGTSGLKRKQIEAYGAELIGVPGPRIAAAQAALKAADDGAAYASHAYLPHNLEGYATCAYEIVDQLGSAPGAVIVPAGQGGLLLGLGRGFVALQAAGRIGELPALIGVQAAACAPLAALFEVGLVGLDLVTEGPTVAEGVRVRTPLRAEAVLKMVEASGGRFVAVAETEILPGRDALARLGFYVEPTSALVWRALNETLPDLREPVVAILTGSGYKAAI
jgi:threonine synthase